MAKNKVKEVDLEDEDETEIEEDETPTPTKGKGKATAAAASAKGAAKQAAEVSANPRVVAAIKQYDAAATQAKSYLATIARIVLNEDLTRAEVVASIMSARNVERSTAETQTSRIMSLVNNEEDLADLESGKADLKMISQRKKEASGKVVSEETKQKNLDKRFATSLKGFCVVVKEAGMSRAAALTAVKTALKSAGVV